MNITIIHNEKIILESLEASLRFYIRKFYPNYESSIHIEVFPAAELFTEFFIPKIYHVVILDYKMSDIARFIRSKGDFNAKIIFLTHEEEF